MKHVLKKLPPEFQLLHEYSKKRRLDYSIQRVLQQYVSRIRVGMREDGALDPLADRFERYGNNGAWSESVIAQLQKALFQDKSPDATDLGRWVSVELEFIFPHKSAEKDLISFIRSKGFTKYCTLKNDGSVHPSHDEDCCANNGCHGEHDDGNDGYECCGDECTCSGSNQFGKELVVTFKLGEYDMLKAICTKMGEIGCKVNKTCGAHVHFDMRHVTARKVSTMAKRVAGCVPALKQLLPKSRQNNNYCQQPINTLSGGSRYSFVNLHSYKKHKTLEIRGHSGTIQAEKIINWIELVKVIMDKPKAPVVNAALDLRDAFELNGKLAGYVQERFAKFNPLVAVNHADDVSEDADTSPVQQELEVA